MDAFTLSPEGHSRFTSNKLLEIEIDGQKIRSRPNFNHSFKKNGETWECGKNIPDVKEKKQGLEGPVYEVFSDKHIFVFGTLGVKSEEEYQKRKQNAKKAADFSVTFGGDYDQPVTVNPRVVSDQEVTNFDRLHSNMILLGDHKTNSIIAEMAHELPFHLNDTTGRYGLVYGYPYQGNYIVINSGVPFWKNRFEPRKDNAQESTVTFGGKKGARALQGMEDFLLYKDSNSNVIVGGFFKNDWSLKTKHREKMKETGVVIDSVGDQVDREF